MDMLSLVPLDLLYYRYGVQAVYLRAPRLLKVQSFWELFRLLDRVIASPYFVSTNLLRLTADRQKIAVDEFNCIFRI